MGPTRRGVLERLGSGSATITELAEPFGITLTGMKKHVRLLARNPGLVSTEKVAASARGALEDARDVAKLLLERERLGR